MKERITGYKSRIPDLYIEDDPYEMELHNADILKFSTGDTGSVSFDEEGILELIDLLVKWLIEVRQKKRIEE
jgi:hypothetical protein